MKFLRLLVKGPDQAQRPVSVMIFKSLRHHILGAGNQHCLTIQHKEVRAFPHPAETALVGGQDPLEFPRKSVRAAVKKNLSVVLRRTVARHAAVSTIRRPPQFGIAEVKPAAVFRKLLTVQYRIARILLIVQPVSHCNALRLHLSAAAVLLGLLDHARIHQQMSAVRHYDRTAGKTAVPVIIHIRRQRRRQLLPVQQICTHRMAPVHGPPVGAERMILIEHMIFPFIIGETVGIVHPSHPRRQMKIRPRLCRDLLLHFLLVSSRIP